MLSAEQNDLITRTGAGTPAGDLMRRYWQPAALVDELSGNRPIKPVRLLGEDLVIFRDERGRYGLIGRRCPHRGTDLAYGRLENGGLRCAAVLASARLAAAQVRYSRSETRDTSGCLRKSRLNALALPLSFRSASALATLAEWPKAMTRPVIV